MVIEELPDVSDDSKKKNIREKKVIHRVITENKKETDWGTLDKVIKGWTDNTSPFEIEEGVNN